MEQNQKPDVPEEEYTGILGDYQETPEEPASAETTVQEEKPKKNNSIYTE